MLRQWGSGGRASCPGEGSYWLCRIDGAETIRSKRCINQHRALKETHISGDIRGILDGTVGDIRGTLGGTLGGIRAWGGGGGGQDAQYKGTNTTCIQWQHT